MFKFMVYNCNKARHTDGGARLRQLRKRWEAPGLAVVTEEPEGIKVVLFMREATRRKWRPAAASARDFRSQQYAPPDPAPADTMEITVGGDADARKKGAPPPPAGFGFVAAVARGQRRVFSRAGQITTNTPNVKTITSNLADLVAFTRALQWATDSAVARGHPICIRYRNEYAARIATGAWKAKKHKAMAEEARRAWTTLRRRLKGCVWIRHTHQNGEANALAAQGKKGRSIYATGRPPAPLPSPPLSPLAGYVTLDSYAHDTSIT